MKLMMFYSRIREPILIEKILNTAYATETKVDDSGYIAYCKEQADLAGIENTEEKNLYVKECTDSFITPSADSQPQD
jgi:hypothetical protein